MPYIIGIILLIVLAIYLWPLIVILGLGYILYRAIRVICKNKYFNSEEFLNHKKSVDETIQEYNEISDYVKTLPNNNSFISSSKNSEHSHLATFENTSNYQYDREKNKNNFNDSNVYSTSLQVVRKASDEPIKYLCKYFGVSISEESLAQLQKIGENISKMEETVNNLTLREQSIKNGFNPPKFITKYYSEELNNKIGMQLPNITPDYSQYIFEYVSAGGNSSQKSVITFNSETVEATAQYILDKLKFKKSAQGQRALMTKALREHIKERDNYTCQICKVSTFEQDLLLLEVDHIIPVSKGGLSTLDNLQTLCWKCNRTKSNKIL
ncbi:HNH endonuclease [Lactococcus garvieae]|nr:HNH endonuclease [Lactococcus garvieae]CEF51372.1 HNH endonuclease [Lactococcus garvieae]